MNEPMPLQQFPAVNLPYAMQDGISALSARIES